MHSSGVRSRVSGLILVCIGAIAACALSSLLRTQSAAQQPAEGQSAAQPPANQSYVGTRECAACHLDQFMIWRNTPHAKAFDILPEKYRADASCLKCHTTGHGKPSGFTSMEATPNLAGNSCEGCHGAGSKHVELAKSFGQQRLTPEQETQVRATIHKLLPQNVCIECHATTAHKPHPQFDK